MKKLTPKQIKQRYEFAIPQRQLYGYWEGNSTGQKKMQRVFDSTAINSTNRFANRMQSGVFPSQRMWCRLEPGNNIPFEQKAQVQAVQLRPIFEFSAQSDTALLSWISCHCAHV